MSNEVWVICLPDAKETIGFKMYSHYEVTSPGECVPKFEPLLVSSFTDDEKYTRATIFMSMSLANKTIERLEKDYPQALAGLFVLPVSVLKSISNIWR